MKSGPPIGRVIVLLFAAILVAVAFGALPKWKRREEVALTRAEVNGPRRVLVGKVVPAPLAFDVTLQGSANPLQSTALYSKVTGFVRSYTADLGDRVKAGQILAIVDAPETYEELKLAEARRHEAEVNLDISKHINETNERLSQNGLLSSQEADRQRALTNSAIAALGTSRAEVGRVGALVGYQRVIAPFDGVVVRRGVETGALVTPNVGATGTVLFEVAKLDTLKITVDIPQSLARFVKVGGRATVFAPGAPTQRVEGTVTRTSGVLDTATRTLRAEIQVPGEGALLSGSFVSVRLHVERTSPPLMVPAASLVFRKEGTRVAIIDAQHTIRYATIVIGRDFGKELEVLDGVHAGDMVAVNPPDDLAEGATVVPVEPKADGAH